MVSKICKEFLCHFSLSCLPYIKSKAGYIPTALKSFEKPVTEHITIFSVNTISPKYNSSLANSQIFKHFYIQITNSLCKLFLSISIIYKFTLLEVIPNIHYLSTSFYKNRWKLHTSLISNFSSILMMSTDLISSTPAVKLSCETCISCFNVEISSGSLVSPKDV